MTRVTPCYPHLWKPRYGGGLHQNRWDLWMFIPPNCDGTDVDPPPCKARQTIRGRKAACKNAMHSKKWQVLPKATNYVQTLFFGWSVLKIDQLFPKFLSQSRVIFEVSLSEFSLLDALIAIFQENGETRQPLRHSWVLHIQCSRSRFQYKNNPTYLIHQPFLQLLFYISMANENTLHEQTYSGHHGNILQQFWVSNLPVLPHTRKYIYI